MRKIYYYKLTTDDGGAPCVQNDLLSLAICKPGIRSTAEEGDLVFGFAANSLDRDNPLIYVARVTNNLRNGEYFEDAQYFKREDCIYRFDGDRFVWKNGSLHHHDPYFLDHDLGKPPKYSRANVLLSEDFRYFGGAGTDDYKSKFPRVWGAIKELGPGHRVHHAPELRDQLDCMAEWVWQTTPKMKIGEPMNKPSV